MHPGRCPDQWHCTHKEIFQPGSWLHPIVIEVQMLCLLHPAQRRAGRGLRQCSSLLPKEDCLHAVCRCHSPDATAQLQQLLPALSQLCGGRQLRVSGMRPQQGPGRGTIAQSQGSAQLHCLSMKVLHLARLGFLWWHQRQQALHRLAELLPGEDHQLWAQHTTLRGASCTKTAVRGMPESGLPLLNGSHLQQGRTTI